MHPAAEPGFNSKVGSIGRWHGRDKNYSYFSLIRDSATACISHGILFLSLLKWPILYSYVRCKNNKISHLERHKESIN